MPGGLAVLRFERQTTRRRLGLGWPKSDPMKGKQLFLLDGLGALVSAGALGLLLPQFESLTGVPANALYWLAALACGLAAYSAGCWLWAGPGWRPWLRALALLNIAYGCLTAGLMVIWQRRVTGWGLGYFLLELLVISGLVLLELRASRKYRAST